MHFFLILMEIHSGYIRKINHLKFKKDKMNHTYKITELAGTSPDSIEQAVKNAIDKAGKTIRNMRWLQVVETRAHLENQKISHWQVVIKVGFTIED